MFEFPYINFIWNRLNHRDLAMERTFGIHMHLGYWEKPWKATQTLEELARAQKKLADMVIENCDIHPGNWVLDVGCGFGGTMQTVSQFHDQVKIVGVGNDFRQLSRGKKILSGEDFGACRKYFVQADGSALPFKEDCFQTIFALESVFHFSSRNRFYRGVSRVGEPGACLAVTEWVPSRMGAVLLGSPIGKLAKFISRIFFGRVRLETLKFHASVSRKNRLRSSSQQDWTWKILPTYRILMKLLWRYDYFTAVMAVFLAALAQAGGLVRYRMMVFSLSHR